MIYVQIPQRNLQKQHPELKQLFVSLTNGDAGHHEKGGGALAKIRMAEAKEAGKRFGVEYKVLDNHDGELMPTLENRKKIIRIIRQ